MYKSAESNVMHFAAFSCAVVTKQRNKQLLAWWRKRTVVRTQINQYEHSLAGAGGGGSKRTLVRTRQANQVWKHPKLLLNYVENSHAKLNYNVV